jgi:quercetin dioxygenase-like cupin family protein
MKIVNMADMYRGWFIGDFEPSVFRTKDFEVGVLTHKKGEYWEEHYHKIATEINVLLEGSMSVNGIHISAGDVFVFEPNESSSPVFHEDCKVLCVKTPSVIGDKYATIRE